MRLFDALRRVGGRLGIVRVVTAEGEGTGDRPCKVTTRTVALGDLAAEVKQDEVKALAEMPAELSVPFAKVFDAAGVKPPGHGWTVERLASLLHTEQFQAMDRPSVQKAVLGLLANDKAQVEDVVKDAVARDRSIDAYEGFVRGKMRERAAARERQIAEVRAKIRELEAECARNAEESKVDQEQWRQWLQKKAAFEKDIAWALGFLLDKPVVTVTEPDDKL
jgi:hypothetical protein